MLSTAAGAAVLALGLAALLNGWSLEGGAWRELADQFSTDVRDEFAFELLAPWTVDWALANARFAAVSFPWPPLLLVLPGLALAHWRRWPLPGRWLLLSMIWSTYLILTLMPHKMERYLQPLYPVLCLLAVWWITAALPRRWQRAALPGVAAGFAATLVVAHLHPTPWLPESRADQRWMHELGMPGQELLRGLRARTYHPACELKPVLRQIGALADARPGRRPLALAVNWPAEDGRFGRWELTTTHLYVGLTQTRRDRFVVYKDVPNEVPLDHRAAHLIQAPTLIVMHPPGRVAGSPVGRRRLTLRCGEDRFPVVLSAYASGGYSR